MRLTHVKISQILGIEYLEFSVGDTTTITGRNKAGKTSVLRAIKAALGGGHDATLIRQGSKEGEVVLLFDSGMSVDKIISPEASKLVVLPKPYGVGPQTFLNTLQDTFGLNPIDVLADEKNRADLILGSLKLRVESDELAEAVEFEAEYLATIPADAGLQEALSVIAYVRKEVYALRTEDNKDMKRARQRVEELQRSIPSGEEESSEEALQEWLDEYTADEQQLTEQLRTIHGKKQELRDRIKRISTDANTHLLITQEKDAEEEAARLSGARTAALVKLDNLKIKVAGRLPFGLEIDDDGVVCQKGIPFANLNTEAQISLAMDLATRRASDQELALVCVDGIERLDTEHRALFYEWADANKKTVQIIATHVVDLDLGVTSDEVVVKSSAKKPPKSKSKKLPFN